MSDRMISMFIGMVLLSGHTASYTVSADSRVYGHLQFAAGHIDRNGKTSSEVYDEGIYFGVKGLNALNSALDLTYILEGASHVPEEKDFFGEVRQAWVGLRGGFGEVRVGRQLGPTRVSSERIDLFTGQYGDYNTVLESDIPYRNSLTYINRLGPFRFAFAAADLDSDAEGTALDATVVYINNSFFAALGVFDANNQREAARLSTGYRFSAGHQLGLVYETGENKKTTEDYQTYLVSGGYRIGNVLLKAQYGQNQPDNQDAEVLQAIGADYYLTPDARLTFEYTRNIRRDHFDDEQEALAVGFALRF